MGFRNYKFFLLMLFWGAVLSILGALAIATKYIAMPIDVRH